MQNLKNILIPVAAIVSLSACSSAYQSGQTPDDVYFSAAPAVVAKTEARRAMQGSMAEDDGEYQSYWANAADDNYLRQKVKSGGRWNAIDDFNYWNGYNYMNGLAFNPYMYNYNYNAFNMYSPWGLNTWNTHWGYNRWGYDPWAWGMGGFYGSGFNMGFNNFYGRGMYNYWNYPGYYPVVVVKNPSNLASPNRQPLRGYNNSSFYNGNQQRTGTAPKQQEGLFRSVFSNGNGSQQSQSFDRSSRSFNTNTQSSSTMGSSGSSMGSSRSSGSSGGGSSSSGRGGRGG